jgi:hypothetical protein
MSDIPNREKVQRSVDRMHSLQTMYYTIEWLGNPVSAIVTRRTPIPYIYAWGDSCYLLHHVAGIE